MKLIKSLKLILPVGASFILAGCSFFNSQPTTTSYPTDACLMLRQNPQWLTDTLDVYYRWGVPVSIQLATIYQESHFRYNARPVKKNKWWQFGTHYQSTSVGFTQALNGTWGAYEKATHNEWQTRESFKDATNFIGWYYNRSNKLLGISLNYAYALYLSYYQGYSGYANHLHNPAGTKLATNVQNWANRYHYELEQCHLPGLPKGSPAI
ncbi:MAG: hypothetical protein R3Y52_03215 [Psittacicella sp.]